jgi:site-specific DNA recombinase
MHTDLDESGARDDRPGLTEALRRVEAHETDGIVVAKLDRFARSLTAALEAIQRVDRAGGTVVSVAEGIDPGTPAGKMMVRLLLVFAEWELDRLRESWSTARERAVARGVHIASATPTGYRRAEDGRLIPNPKVAPVIEELFAMRAGGGSWRELAAHLDKRRVEGPYGALNWRTRAVTHIIENRVYLGEARSGEFVNPDAHQALVDRATWEAAQSVNAPPPSRGEPSLLAGLLRCAGCRHAMKPDRMTLRSGERVRTYRCRGEHASGRCQQRCAVLGTVIEPWLERELLERLDRVQAEATGASGGVEERQAAVVQAEAELAAFRDDERIVGALGADRYVQGLRKRAEAVKAAYGDLAELEASSRPAGVRIADARAMWPELTVRERQKILRAAIDCVFLRRGRQLAIDDRALILWRGQAPDDLPRRGLKRVELRPFVWPADPPHNTGISTAQDPEKGELDRAPRLSRQTRSKLSPRQI